MNTTGIRLALRLTLGRKLLLVLFAFTGLFAANFLAYNYLLRELASAGAAVDAAGRQRMLSQKIAYLAFQVALGHEHDRGELRELTAEFHETLTAFKHGGPSRDFYVYPAPESLAPLIRAEEAEWEPYREAALLVSESPAGGKASKKALAYIESHSEALLADCDELTAAFRGLSESATARMSRLILALIGLTLLFGAAVFFFVKRKVVAPLKALNAAAGEIAAGTFRELPPPESDDEVGSLTADFTKMSGALRREQEERAALAGLLALSLEQGDLPELLGKFLKNLLAIPWLASSPKGAIFLADSEAKNLTMAAGHGLPAEVGEGCLNLPAGRCLCGKAAATRETSFTPEVDKLQETDYKGPEPHGHYCVPIKLRGKVIGVLNLYVRAGHRYERSEQVFLEAACAVIAKTIEYKNLEAKTFQGQKMESLGRAAGAIAHDFNNILTVAQGFNNLALDTVPEDKEAHRFIKETAAGLDRGAALVKQIMAFSRNQPEEMSKLDLNSVIENTRVMLGVILERKIKLKLSLAPGLPPITGNKGQLEQILVNLAVNARDAILPETGELSISTTETAGDAAATCGKELEACSRVVRLTVSDTGRGMPEEVKEHVFEPFFTTKPEGQGTGLGLATVYSIVRLHKGGINITSSPGKGTAFDICFPANA